MIIQIKHSQTIITLRPQKAQSILILKAMLTLYPHGNPLTLKSIGAEKVGSKVWAERGV